jgi:tryptophan synthase beta chain
VVTAAVAARLGMRTVVFMDASQISRQAGSVFRMQSMGARVIPTEARKLRGGDLREAALAHWAERPNECFVVMGLDSAPAPYPQMARDFSAAIGRECLRQVTAMTRRPPDVIVARVGNNADALGLFTPFVERSTTRLVGIEVREELAPTAAERQAFTDSVAAAAQAALNEEQKRRAQVILEGLEYPSVAREQQWLRSTGRVQYASVTDAAARDALKALARTEGLVAAIETSQAIAWACQEAARLPKDQSVVLMYAENPSKNIWALSRQIGLQH